MIKKSTSEKYYPVYCKRYQVLLVLLFFFLVPITKSFSQESILEQKITIPEQRTTIYEVLNQISDITGYFFIYDSKYINSDKLVRVGYKDQQLKTILYETIRDSSLDFKVLDYHILIYKKPAADLKRPNQIARDTSNIRLYGRVYDAQTKKPLAFVSIGIVAKNIGTVSNNDGFFMLHIPGTLANTTLNISHLGYKTQNLPVRLVEGEKVDIYLEVEYVSIQEVIIRNIDALTLVKEALNKRQDNYPGKPAMVRSFYREGVLKNTKYINYSEAVIDVYKSPYFNTIESDQVKLLKSRKLINTDQNDTVVLKIKAGLRSSLTLDIAKNIPDFLDVEYLNNYLFSKSDIVTRDNRSVYAISFVQKDFVTEPLFKGILYIDMRDLAIVGADFEINPEYIDKAADMFLVKKGWRYSVKPQRVGYTVSYRQWNGKYYLNHIRGDLNIKVRKRNHLFYNNFNAFFELVGCQVDTLNVSRLNRNEVLKTNIIMADENYSFDEKFWEGFNIITPEESLTKALNRINAKIEEIKSD